MIHTTPALAVCSVLSTDGKMPHMLEMFCLHVFSVCVLLMLDMFLLTTVALYDAWRHDASVVCEGSNDKGRIASPKLRHATVTLTEGQGSSKQHQTVQPYGNYNHAKFERNWLIDV